MKLNKDLYKFTYGNVDFEVEPLETCGGVIGYTSQSYFNEYLVKLYIYNQWVNIEKFSCTLGDPLDAGYPNGRPPKKTKGGQSCKI